MVTFSENKVRGANRLLFCLPDEQASRFPVWSGIAGKPVVASKVPLLDLHPNSLPNWRTLLIKPRTT
jgi:hypothetical protein